MPAGGGSPVDPSDRLPQESQGVTCGRVLSGARARLSFAVDSATVERCAESLVQAALVSGPAPPPQAVPAAMRDRATLWWLSAEEGTWHRFPDAVCASYARARADGRGFLLYRPRPDKRLLLLPQVGKQVCMESGRCWDVCCLQPRRHGLHYCSGPMSCGPCHSVQRAMAGADAPLAADAASEVRSYVFAAAAAPCSCQCRYAGLRSTWNALAWLAPLEGGGDDAARAYVALTLDFNTAPGHTDFPLSQRCVPCLARQACIDHARQCDRSAATGCSVPLCDPARRLLGHVGCTPVASPLVAMSTPQPAPAATPAPLHAALARSGTLHADSLLSDAFLETQQGADAFSLPLLAPDSGAYAEVAAAMGAGGGVDPTLLAVRAVVHPPSAAAFAAALREAGHLPAPKVTPRGAACTSAAEASRCLLVHGTRRTDPLRVLRSGMTCQASRAVFDPGSTLYGAGLYFAESLAYVHRGRYAFALASGARQVLLCRTLPTRVREYGDSTDRMVAQAPADTQGRPCDTATAATRATGGDRIWVAYRDAHVLPVALVTYRVGGPPEQERGAPLFSDALHCTVSCDQADVAPPSAGPEIRLHGDAGRSGAGMQEEQEDEDDDPFANVVASLSSDPGDQVHEHPSEDVAAEEEEPHAKRRRRDCLTPSPPSF